MCLKKQSTFLLSCFFFISIQAFAFLPTCHKVTMDKVKSTLFSQFPQFAYAIPDGHYLADLEPDLQGPSHGYNVFSNKGNILDMVRGKYQEIVNKWRSGKDASKEIRWLVHYIADCLTIGQICGPTPKGLWGKKDDAIDLACEFVSDKKKLPSHVIVNFANIDSALTALKEKMYGTYTIYYPQQQQWFANGEVSVPEVSDYCRKQIAETATYAASFIYLASLESRR